jgi:anti-sigma factor RsiW
MSECSEISLLLGPFEDGELEPHEMQEVARHLAACSNCEKTLGDYNSISRQLRALQSIPPLDGFARAVDLRIARLATPWRARIDEFLSGINQRIAAATAIVATAGAVAILTALVVTPYIHQRWGNQLRGASLAKLADQGESKLAAATTQEAEQLDSSPTVTAAAGDSHAVISRLESEFPSVAVWSEPQNDTTVIWLPEQQP